MTIVFAGLFLVLFAPACTISGQAGARPAYGSRSGGYGYAYNPPPPVYAAPHSSRYGWREPVGNQGNSSGVAATNVYVTNNNVNNNSSSSSANQSQQQASRSSVGRPPPMIRRR